MRSPLRLCFENKLAELARSPNVLDEHFESFQDLIKLWLLYASMNDGEKQDVSWFQNIFVHFGIGVHSPIDEQINNLFYVTEVSRWLSLAIIRDTSTIMDCPVSLSTTLKSGFLVRPMPTLLLPELQLQALHQTLPAKNDLLPQQQP
jgi:hypothetical protein